MPWSISDHDIAVQFVNQDRTSIRSPTPYPMFRVAADEQIMKLKRHSSPEAIMMVEELSWYQEKISGWNPKQKPTEEERQETITEFLILIQKSGSYLQRLERQGLRDNFTTI